MDYSPIVLKNKGVPIKLAQVTALGADIFERALNENDEVIEQEKMLRFTNNVVAEIEQHWGGLENWQTALEQMPVSTIRQTLSYALKMNLSEVGEAMLDGEIIVYSNAIGVAWAIANGVDPIVASRMLKQSAVLAEEQKQSMQKVMDLAVQENFPGDSGTQPGPKRAARSKSSGTSAQPK